MLINSKHAIVSFGKVHKEARSFQKLVKSILETSLDGFPSRKEIQNRLDMLGVDLQTNSATLRQDMAELVPIKNEFDIDESD